MTAPAPLGASARRYDLRTALDGDLVEPEHPGYALAKQLQNIEHDAARPRAVAYCASEADVSACVRFARETGTPAHIRSGGHSFNGWSTGDGLVIDTSRLNHVLVGDDTVRLGPGAQSVDVLDILKRSGRQLATGTFPTVSAGGFLSGGGLGWQTRKFGVASDRIVSARLVLADGSLARCSAQENADLYWAVRGGGGGNFGVVVDFELRPIEAPVLVGFDLMWGFDRAPQTLAAWQQWCVAAAPELGSSLVVLPKFRADGSPSIRVWGGYHGPRGELLAALEELAERVGERPARVSVTEELGYAEAMHQSMCGGQSVAECHRTGHNPDAQGHRHPYTLRDYRLTGQALTVTQAERALGAWARGRERERYLLCMAVGGRANETPAAATAYPHRDAQFLMGFQVALDSPNVPAEEVADAAGWIDTGAATLDELTTGVYINFPSTKARPGWAAECHGENLSRLVEVKRRHDPDGFFRHAQSVPG